METRRIASSRFLLDGCRHSFYYDSHPTEDDLLGQSSPHSRLVHYLINVLTQLFHGQQCAIHKNLNFYQTIDPMEYPLDPDIAVIKGVEEQNLGSYCVGKTGPAPHVVFEIAMEETWHRDLKEYPAKYAWMGVQEYFVYDPHEPPIGQDETPARRLFGWQLDTDQRAMRELPGGQDGRIWSSHLNSWLVPEGRYLRLYRNQGNLRQTEAEAMARLAEAAIKRAEVLAEKLRSLGIDPNQI